MVLIPASNTCVLKLSIKTQEISRRYSKLYELQLTSNQHHLQNVIYRERENNLPERDNFLRNVIRSKDSTKPDFNSR